VGRPTELRLTDITPELNHIIGLYSKVSRMLCHVRRGIRTGNKRIHVLGCMIVAVGGSLRQYVIRFRGMGRIGFASLKCFIRSLLLDAGFTECMQQWLEAYSLFAEAIDI
jgi:hypothetical protein